MIRPAPISFAERTASRPTAPSPTTTAVTPGLTLAASAANQPVPMTSESVSRLGMRSSGGSPGVATRVPSASGTRSRPACAPPTSSRWTQDVWYPARQIGQAVIDRHVRPGGPVRDLSDLVRVGAPAFLRDRPRQVPVLLPPEEVVHRERQRQQRGEVPAGLAFEQRRVEGRGSDLEANLHRAHHLL